jgi:PAS domain S-box-containing protein
VASSAPSPRELVALVTRRALLLPLLLAALLAAVLVGLIAHLLSTQRWVLHTDDVIAQASAAEEQLLSMQAAVRGYALSQEPGLLTRFEQASAQVSRSFAQLAALVGDNPPQVAHARALEAEALQWVALAGQTRDLARTGPGASGLRAKVLEGQAQLDRVRAGLDQFVRVEVGLREGRVEATRRAALLTVGGTLGLSLLLGAAIAAASRRHLRRVEEGYEGALSLTRAQGRALVEGEERFRLLVEGVQDYAIYLMSEDGRVQSWNPGAERVKGYRAEEVLGQHFSLFATEEERREGRPGQDLAAAAARGSVSRETWRVRKGGIRFWAETTLTALRGEGGALRGYAQMTRDLTERRRAEEELRQLAASLEQRVAERTEELRAVNGELEAFSYSVSHDLRAPLRAIDGFSKVVLERFGGQLDAQGRNYLERVRAGSQRMGRLIDDLLRLSRISRADLRPQPVDLASLAREALAELRARDPSRPVEVEVPDRLPAHGDADLLRVALGNLLGNAWKFTGKRADARIALGREEHGGETVYYVRDNGAGFDMRYASKLFAPFQRLHDAGDFEGTGVGLATVQRVLARHGGRAWAEGRVGEGATVFFTLGGPAAAPGAEGAEGGRTA